MNAIRWLCEPIRLRSGDRLDLRGIEFRIAGADCLIATGRALGWAAAYVEIETTRQATTAMGQLGAEAMGVR